MVMNLQMKLKQKLGVAAVFALGIFVIISGSRWPSCFRTIMQHNHVNDYLVIRAYYSHRNETMLTCTVSMVENAIAIIASCLPALRSMILGSNTQKGTNSYGKHYELTTDHRKTNNTRANEQPESGLQTRRTKHTPNDSEDSLVTVGMSVEASSPYLSNGLNEKGGITVETTIATHSLDIAESARSAV